MHPVSWLFFVVSFGMVTFLHDIDAASDIVTKTDVLLVGIFFMLGAIFLSLALRGK